MNGANPSAPELRSLRYRSWLVALVFVAGSVFGYFYDAHAFFISYLEGYTFLLGITLGCLGIWMLHSLVGGQWGDPIGRVAIAASLTLPLMAILFAPIPLGLGYLYRWTDIYWMAHEAPFGGKSWYLNRPFFYGRAALFFVAWLVILIGQKQRSDRATPDIRNAHTLYLQNWSGGGLAFLFFSASFASIDWLLSLDEYFFSTVWGAMILMGFMLSGFAFCIIGGVALHRIEGVRREQDPIHGQKLNDLGNLMLASVILWMYMEFSQYLVVWGGQAKAEIAWYNARFAGGWQWLGVGLFSASFFVPFVCLLFRAIKRNSCRIVAVSLLVLLGQWGNLVWIVGPSQWPERLSLSWENLVVPIALGAIWVGAVAWVLERGVKPFARGHSAKVVHYGA